MSLASFRYLAWGAGVSIALALAAIVLSAGIGMLLAVARLYGWPVLRRVAAAWAVVIRGIPLLILLIGAYFSLPYLGIDLPLYGVVIVVMGVYFGAYMGEVFRAALASIPATQWDAARSLGFRPWPSFRLIVLPQARRISIPPFLNVALTVVKNTSLVSALGGWELVAAGREVGERTGDLLPVYLAVAAGYFLLCFPLSRLAAYLERTSPA